MKALVLAGGVPQIELICQLKKRGYTVILAVYRVPIIGHTKKRLYVAFIQSIFNIRKKDIVLICPIKRT